MEIKTTDVAPFEALGIEHRGAYSGIGQSFGALCGLLAQNNIPMGSMIGIYYDDPQTTPEAELRSFAGLALASPLSGAYQGLNRVTLAGGKYVVARHVGPYDKLGDAWNYVMGPWIEQSGMQPDGRDYFELYIHHDESNPDECITDIYVPVL
jgi:AraC family transcriptional regulator